MKRFTMATALLYGCAVWLPAQMATVRIDTSRVENRVSPRMYSAFAEIMAEDVKWGLTAEMVHDRSFEEVPDYLGLPAGWRLEPDTRNDNTSAIRFEPTADEAYPATSQATGAPEHALRVIVAPGDIRDERRGFAQGHLSVVQGTTYQGYVWGRVPAKNGYTGPLTVLLEEDNTDGATYATATVTGMAGDWRQYRFTLMPTRTDRFAKLTFLFGGAGTLSLDQVSLQPAAAVGQVRPDVEAKIAALHPSFLRWPGGNVAQDYHWQWGIGARDRRPTWVNKAWSNAPEPDDLGTDEYLALCERTHMDPSITVNVDGAGATPEEAAAWVEYVNGPASSKYGAMRAANGHPAPYGVKQWELGNEIFGDWVRGHVTAEQYAQRAVVYAKAMRAVDPSLRLIAVGMGLDPKGDAWNTAVLRTAGAVIDYLAVHDYNARAQNSRAADPRASMMARAALFERNYGHTADLVRQYAPGRDIRLMVNEWNLFYDATTIQSMEGAVYAARLMNSFERQGDVVESNSISDLVNGWIGGVIQSSRDRVYGTAQYYAVQLWADHLGTERVHTDVTGPDLAPGTPAVDAVATRSADKRSVYVKLSNAQLKPVRTELAIQGFAHVARVRMEVLQSGASTARNTFAEPAALTPHTRTLACERQCAVELPANSVAVFTFAAR